MNMTIPSSPTDWQILTGRRPAPPAPPPEPPAPDGPYIEALSRSHGQRHAAAALLYGVNAGLLASYTALQAYAALVRKWAETPVADSWDFPPVPGDTGLDVRAFYTGQPDMTREAGPPGRDFSPWTGGGYSEQQEAAFRRGFLEVVEAIVAGFGPETWEQHAALTLANISSEAAATHARLRYSIGEAVTAAEGELEMNDVALNAFECSRFWSSPAAADDDADDAPDAAPEAPPRDSTVPAATAPTALNRPLGEVSLGDLQRYHHALEYEIASREPDTGDLEGVPFDVIAETPIDTSKIMLGSGGVRYLSVGGCLLFVGPSGVGKSTATTQALILWSLGRPAFGITPTRPLRIVVVQAENDTGDLSATMRALLDGAALTAADRATVGLHARIVSHNSTSGPAFLAYLEQVIAQHQPDMVVVDPLMAYAGGDLTKTEVVASFCRNGLNPIATRHGVAFLVVHHTPKMTNQNSNARARRDYGAFDWQYAAAGSADLANWTRAMLVVEPLSGDVIALRAAKRWPGWLDPGGVQQYVRYFRREREPGRIFWHDAAPGDVAAARSEKSDGPSEQSLAEHRTSALGLVEKEPLPVAAFEAAFMRKTGLGRQRARDVRAELEHDGTLAMSRREPARDGRKYIGTLETIRELEAKWATPNLPGV